MFLMIRLAAQAPLIFHTTDRSLDKLAEIKA